MAGGHTVWLRTHNADGTLKASSPAASGSAAAGGKGGHTVWLRTHNEDGTLKGTVGVSEGTPIPTSDGAGPSDSGPSDSGRGTSVITTGHKSGRTLAARAQGQFTRNIVHYAILFGLALAAYLIVKHVVFGKHKPEGHGHAQRPRPQGVNRV